MPCDRCEDIGCSACLSLGELERRIAAFTAERDAANAQLHGIPVVSGDALVAAWLALTAERDAWRGLLDWFRHMGVRIGRYETDEGTCGPTVEFDAAKLQDASEFWHLAAQIGAVDDIAAERDAARAQADEWRAAFEQEQQARIATQAASDGWLRAPTLEQLADDAGKSRGCAR